MTRLLNALLGALTCATALGHTSVFADEPNVSFQKTVAPFLSTYCAKCHGTKQQKGERRFDRLSASIDNDGTLVDYQDIVDQLNLSEMPPAESEQPSDQERRTVIRWFTQSIERHHKLRKSSSETVLRRLNNREYRNTIRDLFKLDMTMFDPAQTFPRDQTTEHLDNVGETLVTSGFLLSQYLEAADLIVEKAMSPRNKPEVQTWSWTDGFRQQPEIDQVHRKTNGYTHLTLYDVIHADKHEGAYAPIHAFDEGVPHDGWYDIRIQAEAMNREHPYDPAFLATDPSEPLRLGIVAGHKEAGTLHLPQPIEPLLAETDLADEARWYTLRVWLDRGFTPRFTFRNGLMDARNLWGRLVSKYKDQFPKSRGIVENRFNSIKFGKLPHIRIYDVEIKGPFFDEWPTPAQKTLLGPDWEQAAATGELDQSTIRKHLTRFASLAFRRPATEQEIDRALSVVETRRSSGRTPLEAFGDGIKVILCSPGFVYLEEAGESLSAHALASRLSYFLWSSQPDQELAALAKSNELLKPAILKQQTDRMLRDPRSDAFVDGFLDAWLTLRDLGSTPPDRTQFRAYYHDDLGTAMRQETTLFTRYLLDENLSVENFIDSDFTFVNKRLAKLYGIDSPTNDAFAFEKVNLTDRRRGGLLGQASILTVTANGIDTSPVVRGVWLLENFLGTPPSAPPPDVEPLDPDVRGATTIRDQLEKHRNVAACYDCHRKIDPLGFALENFDPIGRWRSSYGRNKPVVASGELPSGQSFKDVQGLKSILAENPDLFTRALTTKLLAYSMGRPAELSDRPHVDQIVSDLKSSNHGFRDLIHLVVQSEPFRSK